MGQTDRQVEDREFPASGHVCMTPAQIAMHGWRCHTYHYAEVVVILRCRHG